LIVKKRRSCERLQSFSLDTFPFPMPPLSINPIVECRTMSETSRAGIGPKVMSFEFRVVSSKFVYTVFMDEEIGLWPQLVVDEVAIACVLLSINRSCQWRVKV
jgi:hypothetical protein